MSSQRIPPGCQGVCSHICYTILLLVFGKVTLCSVDDKLVINVTDRSCPAFSVRIVHYWYSSQIYTAVYGTVTKKARCVCIQKMLTTMKDTQKGQLKYASNYMQRKTPD